MTTRVKHWQDPLNLLLGLWLLASPWVLQYEADVRPMWNATVVGVLIAIMAAAALLWVKAWEEWASIAFGVWLVVSPWVLGFTGLAGAMWNAVVVGIFVALLGLWALGTDKDIGGWWSHAT